VLKPPAKSKIVSEYGKHKTDTGSTEVQIALFTKEIKELTDHLKTHKKDNSSRLGLLKKVGKRRRLIEFLKKESPRKYNHLAKKLELK